MSFYKQRFITQLNTCFMILIKFCATTWNNSEECVIGGTSKALTITHITLHADDSSPYDMKGHSEFALDIIQRRLGILPHYTLHICMVYVEEVSQFCCTFNFSGSVINSSMSNLYIILRCIDGTHNPQISNISICSIQKHPQVIRWCQW